jgi:Dyp-type peroxidase family
MLEMPDIQGIVFSGYAKKPHAVYLLLRVVDGELARQWLRGLSQLITTGADRGAAVCFNVALTARGFSALGLEDDALRTFPLEFREGMSGSETRSRALGDVASSEPALWLWGGPAKPVHVLLMVYACTELQLKAAVNEQVAAFSGGLSIVYERSTQTLPERREHFGFADGIAQPQIAGSDGLSSHSPSAIRAGEFILGYENAYDKLPFVPNVRQELDPGVLLPTYQQEGKRAALGHNGSYLVARQLEQDVPAFWEFMRQAARDSSAAGASGASVADGAVFLASKCVGRWPSGAPLVEAPRQDDPALCCADDFGYYLRDRDGARCPIGSHIRRTNPRDSLEPDPVSSRKVVERHRIMRRGRSYGDPIDKPWLNERADDTERGLVFMCVNANIRRQFEFIQQTWVNNPKFDGLYDERDPLIGNAPGTLGAFTIPAKPVRQRLEGLPAFVTVRGGEYFFLPSIRALRFIAGLAA